MKLFVCARHAHSTLNDERRINGDPAVDVPLTEQGAQQAAVLGRQLANVPLEVCLHTRFPRTLETASIALEGRNVPLEVEPLFDDIDIGDLEGRTIDEYHAWKAKHTRADRFPGGESLDEAARRYVRGYRRLLESTWRSVFVVYHEIPLRYALNGAAGSDDLDGPVHAIDNAQPFLFDEDALARAIQGIERLA